MLCEWKEITKYTHHAVYDECKEDFAVFATYTEHDTYGESVERCMTEWGFKDSESPLIKSEFNTFDGWKYYVLIKCVDDE